MRIETDMPLSSLIEKLLRGEAAEFHDEEDVYKRQPNDKKEVIFERFVKLDSFTQGLGLGLSPVSYTHLDVYKRQSIPRTDLSWTIRRVWI